MKSPHQSTPQAAEPKRNSPELPGSGGQTADAGPTPISLAEYAADTATWSQLHELHRTAYGLCVLLRYVILPLEEKLRSLGQRYKSRPDLFLEKSYALLRRQAKIIGVPLPAHPPEPEPWKIPKRKELVLAEMRDSFLPAFLRSEMLPPEEGRRLLKLFQSLLSRPPGRHRDKRNEEYARQWQAAKQEGDPNFLHRLARDIDFKNYRQAKTDAQRRSIKAALRQRLKRSLVTKSPA